MNTPASAAAIIENLAKLHKGIHPPSEWIPYNAYTGLPKVS
ncbi:hypothetical protein [Acutalibacter muris]|nr:hypothetical protein [Acutalibacter muris]